MKTDLSIKSMKIGVWDCGAIALSHRRPLEDITILKPMRPRISLLYRTDRRVQCL